MRNRRRGSGVSWKNLFSKGGTGSRQDGARQLHPDEDNPWFNHPSLSENSQPTDGDRVQQSSANGRRPPARWLSDNASPHGFSDEDGTLKQVDSQNWRTGFGRSNSRFVPGQAGQSRWQGSHRSVAKPRMLSSTTWFMQSMAALAMVAGGFYVSRTPGNVTNEVHQVYVNAFSQDYSSQLVPAVETFLQDHHVNLPVEWNPSSAIHFHVPLSGEISHDYSPSHPEMTLLGTANEPVLAAGSGTVARITKTDSGSIVMINHGKIGESVYTGVYKVSVKEGQYVSAGEVIGHLASSSSPELQFGFEQDGAFVNPRDYIEFPAATS